MVAAILKSVTGKGLEAASQSVSQKLPSSNTPTIAVPKVDPGKIDQSIDVHASRLPKEKKGLFLSDGGYFLESVSSSISNYCLSAKDTIYAVSDETSKNVYNFGTKLYSTSKATASDFFPHDNKLDTSPVVETPQRRPDNSQATKDKKWFMVMNDPYHTVTGARNNFITTTNHRKSVNAVRNLLQLVDVHHDDEPVPLWNGKPGQDLDSMATYSEKSMNSQPINPPLDDESQSDISAQNQNIDSSLHINFPGTPGTPGRPKRSKRISDEVTASRLGEGTIRAMRDMALDEAIELHDALKFWTERLERPILYYLEFGPKVLTSSEDYHFIGQRVSQLQAVLARRCSCIGELQQHLWRAGWQSGVSQWGILGQGEWDAVVGSNGEIADNRHFSDDLLSMDQRNSIFSSVDQNRGRNEDRTDYYARSHLFVSNVRGGEIVTNDPAMAAWSIDAIRIVRNQLYSAGNTLEPLPYFKNWPSEERYFGKRPSDKRGRLGDSMMSMDGKSTFFSDEDGDFSDLPLWATQDAEENNIYGSTSDLKMCPSSSSIASIGEMYIDKDLIIPEGSSDPLICDIVISDLQLMAAEVTEILNSMEQYLRLQRKRRLDKLKPPSRLIRNWYIAAFTMPVIGYVGYRLFRGNAYVPLMHEVYQKVTSFWLEHVSEPLQSIYRELFTRRGREDVTDRNARLNAIAVLQRMLKSWLEEIHPDMPESEKTEKSLKMDMTLVEAAKEFSVRNILEINNIYRLSLIEMQFIKKEMLTALYAMDEMMGTNEINIKLAAMTPAFILASTCRYMMRKVVYAILKIGKSKEETFASFRHILLDIERLLVMRDNAPPPPRSLFTAGNNTNVRMGSNRHNAAQQSNDQILSSDDLGMLMLLVHECRVILWQDRRRFTRSELRNASEDLAELAGERGAVSVRQQLQIIARMCRTYSFLKVISSGVPFSTGSNAI
uniref:Uncharacterized protein n=2 Tax=Chaetoceros debilis TaxID=122233 RepID=A0A7S3QA01_9STRA